MIWDAIWAGGEFKLTVQNVVDALKAVLVYIFDFIADDQGWVEE